MGNISQKAFGQYIKEVRTEKNMSREELADKLNVSYAAIQKWESGKRYPDFEMVENIADALGITVQDIYDNSKSEERRSIIIPVVSSIILVAVIVGVCIIGFLHNGNGKNQMVVDQETTAAEETTTEADTTDKATTEAETSEEAVTTEVSETTVSDELVEINIFSELGSYYGPQMGYMSKIFEETLGIKVNYIVNLDGNYLDSNGNPKGDIIVAYKDNYDQLAKDGKIIDFNENDFLKNYGNSYIKDGLAEYIRSESQANNGKLFGFLIAGMYGNLPEISFFDFGTCLRWDLYKQLGYPEIKNLEDLVKVLREMKELCPTDDKGNETEAVGLFKFLNTDLPYPVISLLQSYYGVQVVDEYKYYDFGKERYVSFTSDEDDYYRNILYFFNRLYREGMLKTEALNNDYSAMNDNLVDGRYLMTVNNWLVESYNTEKNMVSGKAILPVMAEEAVNISSPSGYNPAFYWCISSSSKNKEKCMELLNYLASPEGMLTITYGPKGLCWDYDENMNTYLTEFGNEVIRDRLTQMPEEWGGLTFIEGVIQTNAAFWKKESKNPNASEEDYMYSHWKTYIPAKVSDIERDWADHTGFNNTFNYYVNHEFYEAGMTDVEGIIVDEELLKNIVSYSEKAIFAADDAEFDQAINDLRGLEK